MSQYLSSTLVKIVWFGSLLLGASCVPVPEATLPETCADVQELAVANSGSRPADGTYTLYIAGDETMPWEAFCRHMNLSSPKEYLTVSESNNFSQVGNGSAVAITRYRRYRIDPIILKIDPLDDAFATNVGFDSFTPPLPNSLTYIPAGWAEFRPARAFDGPAAEANVSLAGTHFVFSDSILASNLSSFFCQVDTPPTDALNTSGTGAAVSADLSAFHLTAINVNPEGTESGVSTREVGDCAHLGPTAETLVNASWPLKYVQRAQGALSTLLTFSSVQPSMCAL